MNCFLLKAAPKFANTITNSGLEKQSVHARGLQLTLFDFKDAVTKRAQDWGVGVGMAEVSCAGSEWGEEEHGAAVGDWKSSAGQRCTMLSLMGLPSAAPVKRTLPEPVERD